MILAGIWSDSAGGFVDGPLYTQEEAEAALAAAQADLDADLDEDQLSIVPMCQEPGHDEQPEDGCELCPADDDDDVVVEEDE